MKAWKLRTELQAKTAEAEELDRLARGIGSGGPRTPTKKFQPQTPAQPEPPMAEWQKKLLAKRQAAAGRMSNTTISISGLTDF